MRIEVSDRGRKAAEPVRNYVGMRLMSVLDHTVRHVNGVAVTLADVEGRDGDGGRRCRMLALLDPSGSARIEKTDSDLYAAIDRAAEELAHVVAFELARRETTTRPSGKLRAGAVVEHLGSESPGLRRG